jgi:DNA primase
VQMYPTITRSDLTTDAQKRELAWRLNMQRRHLNQAQKRNAIANKLKESPEWADNRLAQLLGADSKTVRSVRTSLERGKELPVYELLEGADGKRYPRNRLGETKSKQFMRWLAADVERIREEQVADHHKDLGDERIAEFLEEEADAEEYGTPTQAHTQAVREKMRQLADLVNGYEDKIKSEADPEAVAEAVVELLSEWIERFVPLLEEKLEKKGNH